MYQEHNISHTHLPRFYWRRRPFLKGEDCVLFPKGRGKRGNIVVDANVRNVSPFDWHATFVADANFQWILNSSRNILRPRQMFRKHLRPQQCFRNNISSFATALRQVMEVERENWMVARTADANCLELAGNDTETTNLIFTVTGCKCKVAMRSARTQAIERKTILGTDRLVLTFKYLRQNNVLKSWLIENYHKKSLFVRIILRSKRSSTPSHFFALAPIFTRPECSKSSSLAGVGQNVCLWLVNNAIVS